jgi:peptidoglycan/LPS O-acetylase OafA/YrhL
MRASQAADIRALTGIRGLAACWVVAYHCHFSFLAAGHEGAGSPVLARGYLGVDLFFVLSGFILSHVYRDVLSAQPTWRESGQFYLVRFTRIYPLHLATLALFVMLLLAGHTTAPEAQSLDSFIANLLLVHGWGLYDHLSWNIVSWSISTEWLAYLAFPFAFSLVRTFGCRSVGLGMVGCAGALVLLERSVGSLDVAERLALARCLPEFLLGALCAQLLFLRGGTLITPADAANGVAWAAMALVLGCVLWAPFDAPLVGAFALLVILLADERSQVAKGLSRPSIHYLGLISYSIYMLQYPVGLVVGRSLAVLGLTGPWLRLGCVVVALAVASAISYRYVERTSRDWLRARISSRSRAQERGQLSVGSGP